MNGGEYLRPLLNKFFVQRQIIIKPGEDGFRIAECPGLPGCVSQGESKKEASRNIREATEGCIGVLREEGEAIPGDDMESVVAAV